MYFVLTVKSDGTGIAVSSHRESHCRRKRHYPEYDLFLKISFPDDSGFIGSFRPFRVA
jgi:hypothetical protein